MTNKFSIGDIVILKSGGPDMTVKDVDTGGKYVTCQWFSGKKLEQGLFPTGGVEFVTNDEEA